MSRYDIRGMQASGMTTQQINDFIKQAEANMPKVIQDFRSQVNPKTVAATPVKTPIRQPVKPPVKTPVRAQPILPLKAQAMKPVMKKGGDVKKYTKGGKINLDACGVSTAQKSKSSPKW